MPDRDNSQTGGGSATPVPLAEVAAALARVWSAASAAFREEWARLAGGRDAGS